jgi:hypothetical protein
MPLGEGHVEDVSMAMLLKDFAAISDEELLTGGKVTKCVCCGVQLQESTTGNRPTADGPMCSKCFYKAVGKIIDDHPLGVPRARR